MIQQTLILFLSTLLNIVKCYFLSSNRVTWEGANIFCSKHCKSTLAIINSSNDLETVKIQLYLDPLINTGSNKNVWIGIQYKYNNESLYVSNYNHSYNYPSKQSNKSDTYCVQLSSNHGYKWINSDCNIHSRFVCNSCNSIVNKYIGIDHSESWINAEQYCKRIYNTHLASLHSDNDLQDTLIIVESLSYIFQWGSYHIGLNDINKEGSFVWSDSSTFDFANDTSGGIYPWITFGEYPGEPNNGQHVFGSQGDDDCVVLNWGTYGGNGLYDTVCSTQYKPFICNMPSELCYINLWNILINTNNNMIYNDTCDLSFNSNHDQFEAILYDKQWINSNNILVIEYMFTIRNVSNLNNTSMTGISLNIYNYKYK
eukprot:450680_1